MLVVCIYWFQDLLAWLWMTTGKELPRHHPCDSHKGRSCQRERTGLFFYSSMFPSSPSLFFTVIAVVGLSFLVFVSASFTCCPEGHRHPSHPDFDSFCLVLNFSPPLPLPPLFLLSLLSCFILLSQQVTSKCCYSDKRQPPFWCKQLLEDYTRKKTWCYAWVLICFVDVWRLADI